MFEDGSSLTAEWSRGRPRGLSLRALPTGVLYVNIYVYPADDEDTFASDADAPSKQESFVRTTSSSVYAGSVIRDDGGRYDGELCMGRFHGQGSFLWPNGELYVGMWVHGLRHGTGTHVWPKEKFYSGTNFSTHSRLGLFFLRFLSFFTFPLLITCKSLMHYDCSGEWSESVMHGSGVMVYANGSPREEGIWKDGRLTATGIHKQDQSDDQCIIS